MPATGSFGNLHNPPNVFRTALFCRPLQTQILLLLTEATLSCLEMVVSYFNLDLYYTTFAELLASSPIKYDHYLQTISSCYYLHFTRVFVRNRILFMDFSESLKKVEQ